MRTHVVPLVVVVFLWGCAGPREASTYEVSGAVTWAGAPLDDGEILFTALDGSAAPAIGRIENGRYTAWSPRGMKNVSIRASRLIPGSKGANGEPIHDNVIPDRYNVRTTLTADIRTDRENRFDYALEADAAARGK